MELSFYSKVLIFVIFGSIMKVQRAIKTPECIGIKIKATRDMQSANKVYLNDLESKI